MAYASKSEKRLRGSMDYEASEKTLTSDSYKKTGDMGMKSKDRLVGSLATGSFGKKLYGNYYSRETTSGVAGEMSKSGFTDGPKWKRAMEPGELEPGTRAQAGNTTRMAMGKGEKDPVMKVTSKTPKELEGGRGR